MEASVAMPGTRPDRDLRPWLVASVGLAAAATYLWMRLATARALAETAPFGGYCQRVHPPDAFPCHLGHVYISVSYLASVGLVGLAIASVPLTLAAARRRWSALLPIAVLLIAEGVAAAWTTLTGHDASTSLFGISTSTIFPGRTSGYWAAHSLQATWADAALLAAPAAALLLVAGRRWRDEPRAVPWAVFVSGSLCVGAAIPLAVFGRPNPGYVQADVPAALVCGLFIASFGILLPTRSGFWPWGLALPAIVLSSGPSNLIMGAAFKWTAFTWFRPAGWLFATGFIASLTMPLARRLERRFGSVESEIAGHEAEPATAPDRRRRPRAVVIANAFAAGALIACFLAARFNPLPAQLNTALPTYLGMRLEAADQRAEMDLLEASRVFATYASMHGSSTGFDEVAAKELDASLDWSAVPARQQPSKTRVVQVEPTKEGVRFLEWSGSGAAICAEVHANMATYGLVPGHGYQAASAEEMTRAIFECGSTLLRPSMVHGLPVDPMCDGVTGDQIVLCRAVQFTVRQTLASKTASSSFS